VIAKYELIDLGQVTVNIDRSGGCEVLELNVVLSDSNIRPPVDKKVAAATAP
jgi:cell division topological specificity factor